MKTTALKVSVKELEGLSDALGRVSDSVIAESAADALNVTAEWADEESHRRALGINLDPAYLKAFRSVSKATASNLVATVTTEASNTQLGRFQPQQKVTRAKSPRGRLKGNPPLGIAVGDKPLAVSVEVARGSRKEFKNKNIFLNTGVRDSQGNPMVMERLPGRTRSGKDVLIRKLGPSPYQLFARQLRDEDFVDEAYDRMGQEIEQRVGDAIQKELS